MRRTGNHDRMFLTCYMDIHGYGWHHVDLFVHDAAGLEVNWVHWQVDEDGPMAADAVTALVEPQLKRISDWQHGISANGADYWTADAAWQESTAAVSASTKAIQERWTIGKW